MTLRYRRTAREADRVQASDEDIEKLLGNPDGTLERWFESFLSTEEPGLILTGGETPPIKRIREIFDRWFDRRRAQLKEILCDRLGYGSLSSSQRSGGEVVVVGIIATAIAASPFPDAVDPVLTATLLITRRKLDHLCGNDVPPTGDS
jgi:hypothetical protein